MKKILLAFAMTIILSTITLAQEDPLSITYTVQSTESDMATITLDIEVEVTNKSTSTLDQVTLELQSISGGDDIQGQVVFDQIAVGQTKSAMATFSAPRELFEGASFEFLVWKISYDDPQGQSQIRNIRGSKR